MNNPVPFVPFGAAHTVGFVLVLILVFSVPLLLRGISTDNKRRIAYTLALILLASEITRVVVSVFIYENPLRLSLPFHLCGFASLLTIWMLWRKSYGSYEVALFWGIGGSIPALLTPDLTVGFPHPSFLHFFAGHGLVMLGVLYATFVFGFRPRVRSVFKAISASLLLVVIMAPVNLVLETNYMYLYQKPVQSTLMDYFGPWPWYILSLILIGVMVYIVIYLPFHFLEKRNGKSDV